MAACLLLVGTSWSTLAAEADPSTPTPPPFEAGAISIGEPVNLPVTPPLGSPPRDTAAGAATTATGAPRSGWLGVVVAESNVPGRWRIDEVLADSPASAAGILAGDELRAVNGIAPRNADEVSQALTMIQAEQTVQLAIAREGAVRDVMLRAVPRPPVASAPAASAQPQPVVEPPAVPAAEIADGIPAPPAEIMAPATPLPSLPAAPPVPEMSPGPTATAAAPPPMAATPPPLTAAPPLMATTPPAVATTAIPQAVIPSAPPAAAESPAMAPPVAAAPPRERSRFGWNTQPAPAAGSSAAPAQATMAPPAAAPEFASAAPRFAMPSRPANAPRGGNDASAFTASVPAAPRTVAQGPAPAGGRTALGVRTIPIDRATQARFQLEQPAGAYVTGVVENLPASRAGVPPGSVIVALDERPVQSPSDLTALVTSGPVDRTVTVRFVLPGGETRKADVLLQPIAPPLLRALGAGVNDQPPAQVARRPIADGMSALREEIRGLRSRLNELEQRLDALGGQRPDR